MAFSSVNCSRSVLASLALIMVFVLNGCSLPLASSVSEQVYDDFILITPKAGDTFEQLAARYLQDESKGWVIAQFNSTTELTAGDPLIVPLRPTERGGIKANGLQAVPVLAYQDFSQTPDYEGPGVTASAFDAQMRYLKDNGYHVITIQQFFQFLEFKDELPDKAVLITIDRGKRSVYEVALPILNYYGFPVTLFIQTGLIDRSGALSWQRLKALARRGVSIHCNTHSFRDLSRLRQNESFQNYLQNLEAELKFAKSVLEEKLDIDCQYLAYPFGKTNNLVITLLKKYGYQGAFTTEEGGNPFYAYNYRLRRSEVTGKDDMDAFKSYLTVFVERN